MGRIIEEILDCQRCDVCLEHRREITENIKSTNVCGNSNMRDLTDEDRKNGRSHHCTEDDPCSQCSQNVQIANNKGGESDGTE